MATPAPRPNILLAESDEGQGYCITVVPAQDNVGRHQCFPGYLAARCHARLLAFGSGWKIIDRVDPKIRKAAEAADLVRRGRG